MISEGLALSKSFITYGADIRPEQLFPPGLLLFLVVIITMLLPDVLGQVVRMQIRGGAIVAAVFLQCISCFATFGATVIMKCHLAFCD